jgi:hypothetical protein
VIYFALIEKIVKMEAKRYKRYDKINSGTETGIAIPVS